jgi:hypothetical protein
MKTRFLRVRLTEDEHAAIKKNAKRQGYKSLSAYVRDMVHLTRADAAFIDEVRGAKEAIWEINKSARTLSSNLNQVAKLYNMGQSSAHLIEWDRSNREQLLPVVQELTRQNRDLLRLCNKVLGR